MRNLNKEIHPYTKPSIDFIYKILEDAYNSDLTYDVDDMRNSILGFAASSTNQADACLKIVSKMHFKSKELPTVPVLETPVVFFDCEVFPNLLLVFSSPCRDKLQWWKESQKPGSKVVFVPSRG